jgi:hypothetical protein
MQEISLWKRFSTDGENCLWGEMTDSQGVSRDHYRHLINASKSGPIFAAAADHSP